MQATIQFKPRRFGLGIGQNLGENLPGAPNRSAHVLAAVFIPVSKLHFPFPAVQCGSSGSTSVGSDNVRKWATIRAPQSPSYPRRPYCGCDGQMTKLQVYSSDETRNTPGVDEEGRQETVLVWWKEEKYMAGYSDESRSRQS